VPPKLFNLDSRKKPTTRRGGMKIHEDRFLAATEKQMRPFVVLVPSLLLACGSTPRADPNPAHFGPERSQIECIDKCRTTGRERALCTDACVAEERARNQVELTNLEAGCLVWEEGRCVTKSAYADGGAPPPEE
jgi:hypothetical protein